MPGWEPQDEIKSGILFFLDENLKLLTLIGFKFKLLVIVSKPISFDISTSIWSILSKNDWLNSSTPNRVFGFNTT